MFTSLFHGRYNDGPNLPLKLDAQGHVLPIDHNHALVHAGVVFTYSSEDSLGAVGSTLDYLIVTPADELIHIEFVLGTITQCSLALYRSPTKSANGTLQTSLNRKDNSLKTSNLKIYKGPTITAVGAQVFALTCAFGIAPPQGNFWSLSQGTTYLLRLTSRAAGNISSIRLDWHKHQGGLEDSEEYS